VRFCLNRSCVPSDDTSSSAVRSIHLLSFGSSLREFMPKLDGRSSRNWIIELHASTNSKIVTIHGRPLNLELRTKFGFDRHPYKDGDCSEREFWTPQSGHPLNW